MFSADVQESYLDEGFILDKRIGVGQPKRIENAKILVANTAMDTDKIKIYGARVRVDSMTKVHLVLFHGLLLPCVGSSTCLANTACLGFSGLHVACAGSLGVELPL